MSRVTPSHLKHVLGTMSTRLAPGRRCSRSSRKAAAASVAASERCAQTDRPTSFAPRGAPGRMCLPRPSPTAMSSAVGCGLHLPTRSPDSRGQHHGRDLHLRRVNHPRRLRLLQQRWRWGGYWGKQGPEFLDHRLALYDAEQRLVFGANTCRQFMQLLGTESDLDDLNAWMRSMPATVVSTTLEGPSTGRTQPS